MTDSCITESELVYQEYLGSGGSGDVYKATWKSADGDVEVAAKKIPKDPYITEEVNSEIEILKKFDHENVIKYYGHLETNDHIIIVTEFAAKGSLHAYLKTRSRLHSSKIRKWALEAARAIEYLRKRRVIHRDVKSHNFLITADGTLKICDFGLAKHLSRTRKTSTQSGTYSWLAPEVFDNILSPKADVFAYGIVLWELITCDIPYEGRPVQWVIFRVVTQGLRPTIPDHCPPGYKALMEECWDAERNNRPDIENVVKRLEDTNDSFAFGKY